MHIVVWSAPIVMHSKQPRKTIMNFVSKWQRRGALQNGLWTQWISTAMGVKEMVLISNSVLNVKFVIAQVNAMLKPVHIVRIMVVIL